MWQSCQSSESRSGGFMGSNARWSGPTFRGWRETEGRGRSPWPRARHEGNPFLRFSNKDRVSRLSQGRDKRMLESPDLAWICQLRPQSGGWGEKAQDGVTSVWWVDPRAWSPQGHQGVTHCAPRWQSVQAGVLHGQEWTPPCWWVIFSITRSWEAQARHGSGGWTQSQLFPVSFRDQWTWMWPGLKSVTC